MINFGILLMIFRKRQKDLPQECRGNQKQQPLDHRRAEERKQIA